MYPLEVVESLETSSLVVRDSYPFVILDELQSQLVSLQSGQLRDVYVDYDTPPESLQSSVVSMVTGTLRGLQILYNAPPESLQSSLTTLQTASLLTLLISYDNYPPEELESPVVSIISGTLV